MNSLWKFFIIFFIVLQIYTQPCVQKSRLKKLIHRMVCIPGSQPCVKPLHRTMNNFRFFDEAVFCTFPASGFHNAQAQSSRSLSQSQVPVFMKEKWLIHRKASA